MPEEKHIWLGPIGSFEQVLDLFKDGWQRDKTFSGMGNEKIRIYRLFRYSEEELAAMEAPEEPKERPLSEAADLRQPHPEKDWLLVEELKKKGYVYTNKWKGCVELTLWEDIALANLAQEQEEVMATAEGEAQAQAEWEEHELSLREEEERMEHEEGAPPET